MNVFILRHGHAEAVAPSDAQRALSSDGKREVNSVVNTHKVLLANVDHIYCSPLRRAQETAAIVTSCCDAEITETALLLPEADITKTIGFLGVQCESFNSVLLVSHQPLVSRMIDVLCDQPRHSQMRTASLASLECDPVARGLCVLDWVKHPYESQR